MKMTDVQGAGESQLKGDVLLYKQPEPLNSTNHKGLGLTPAERPYAFLKTVHFVPLTVQEFGLAATSMPIIFGGDGKVPLAVMGLRQNENLFINDEGNYEDDVYVPAYIRRYPFVFASDDDNEQMVVCIDRASEAISDKPEFPFFNDDGQPSSYTQDVINFLRQYEGQNRATQQFITDIKDLDIFETRDLSVQNPGSNGGVPQQVKITDYVCVSEQKLNALSPEKLAELRDKGYLAAIYAHMVSMLNWTRLIQKVSRKGALDAQQAAQPAAKPKKSPAKKSPAKKK